MKTNGFIPSHGNYRQLLSYRKAKIIYDATFCFCERFLRKGDRTIDQMIQAARSGKQNIIEGSKAAKTSKESQIKLTNVARASLEELLEDFHDYLRVRHHKCWDKNSREAQYVRKIGKSPNSDYTDYREFIETRPAETVANIIICLIHQANYLLDRQIQWQEKDFLEGGGLRENMTRARIEARTKQRYHDLPRKPDSSGSESL